MEDASRHELSVPEHILEPLLNSANCSTLDGALENLIQRARTEPGRSELASKNTVVVVLQLIKFLSTPSTHILLSALKLLRNLCAGELRNQNSFISNNGVDIVSVALNCVGSSPDSDIGIVRTGLQLLGNVSLAGKEHQRAIWLCFFPNYFKSIAKMRRLEICDPLCMVIYNCFSGSSKRAKELCGVQGLKLVEEIIRTASIVGFGEEWLRWLLTKVCFEKHYFNILFYQLVSDDVAATGEDNNSKVPIFSEEQAFLLAVLSESLNQPTDEIFISNDFAVCVFGILKKALRTVDLSSRGKSSLPTGIPPVDVLGYSIIILRDVCAQHCSEKSSNEGVTDIVDSLISSGLLELLLDTLRELEPPEIIRKSIARGENHDTFRSHDLLKKCPYRGFRRDIVAVIGNCLHQRKYAQDEIRDRNGLLLLLQQCVVDEENPFLREWGIWLKKNLFEENNENKQEIAALELQEVVDAPEVAALGLRVTLDEKTRRPKLVNVQGK